MKKHLAILIMVSALLVPPLAAYGQGAEPVIPLTNGAPVSTANPMPVTGSLSSSIAGFHLESSLAPITATTGGVTSSAFTAGKNVVVTNKDTANPAYCAPGATATTSSQPIPPNNGWFAFTTTSETTVTCATSTSTAVLNLQVGTGLATGTGGGGGGSGGGVVTQPTAALLNVTEASAAAALAAIQAPVPTSAPTDCSGTVTSGGTAQSIISAGGAPHGFIIQDLAIEAMGFSWTTTTPVIGTNGTYTLNAGSSTTSAGGTYTSPLGLGVATAVYLISATTGSKFTCTRW